MNGTANAPLTTTYEQAPIEETIEYSIEQVSEVSTEIIEVIEEEVQPKSVEINAVATFYTATCEGCIGITKTGDDVRQTIYAEGHRVIAVDPNIIPLRSIVHVRLEDGTEFQAIASDTGGAIKGNRIDVLVKTVNEAYEKGRQTAVITILESGGD